MTEFLKENGVEPKLFEDENTMIKKMGALSLEDETKEKSEISLSGVEQSRNKKQDSGCEPMSCV